MWKADGSEQMRKGNVEIQQTKTVPFHLCKPTIEQYTPKAERAVIWVVHWVIDEHFLVPPYMAIPAQVVHHALEVEKVYTQFAVANFVIKGRK